mgnify:CR=1 FL=1
MAHLIIISPLPRHLEHSTIIYEDPHHTPLLRLAWNKQDPNYLAAVLADDPRTVILDVRVPSIPVAELGAHQASVNSVAWAHSLCLIALHFRRCTRHTMRAMPRIQHTE